MKYNHYLVPSFIDYPGKIVITLFTLGCNLDCPWCHNADLKGPIKEPNNGITTEEVITEIKKIKAINGICITGGEPSMWGKKLISSLRKFKKELPGIAIKLDTNGTNLPFVKQVVSEGLIDKIAIDVKATKENYYLAIGLKKGHPLIKQIFSTIEWLRENYYENTIFRTTCGHKITPCSDIEKIKEQFNLSKIVTQEYRPVD